MVIKPPKFIRSTIHYPRQPFTPYVRIGIYNMIRQERPLNTSLPNHPWWWITEKHMNRFLDKYEGIMSTEWVIQDEWSEYHAMVAATLGFLLVYNEGLWEIHTLDDRLFPTDEDARNFVLAHEHDQDTQIYAYAIRAIIVGSMRGDRSNGKRGKRGEK